MKTLEQRFWEKVNKTETCWIWTASKDAAGYGFFRVESSSSMRKAHRVAWELTFGSIPYRREFHGTVVMHTCDMPSCVRPSHLTLGTQKENMNSASVKGRIAHAERSGNHKLTSQEVRDIRRLRRDLGVPHAVIGLAYGVNASVVSLLVRRKIWSHT